MAGSLGKKKKKKFQSPDGGWGWLIVLAAFTLQTLSIGVTYTFGIMMTEWLQFFNENEWTLAWIGSIQAAMLYFTGIIAGPLLERFGWRVNAMGGCLVSAIGYASSALVNNVFLLYLTYGFFTGIGNGLMYTTSMVAVQHYFEKRRVMATGIAVSGSGCGPFVFGLLLPPLLARLDWRWTLVVVAAFFLLGFFISLLFRPLPLLEEAEKEPIRDTISDDDEPEDGRDSKESSSKTSSSSTSASACCQFLTTIIDVKILRNPVFRVFCVVVMLFCFGYHVPYVYTPVRAEKACGISAEHSAMLVSIMGIANVCSRLLLGWLADRSEAMRFYLGAFMLIASGGLSIIIFVFNSYPALIFYSAAFGAFTGCWVALFPCLLVDLLGIENIERSLGHCMAFCAVSFLVATPLSGMVLLG